MISAHQCCICASDCAVRAKGTYVSLQRAAILVAMSKRWTELADLTDEYEAVVSATKAPVFYKAEFDCYKPGPKDLGPAVGETNDRPRANKRRIQEGA